MYLLVMPKYWGERIFTPRSFPEVGQKQKTEKKERERPKVGNNNCQLCIATPPLVAHASWRLSCEGVVFWVVWVRK